MPVNQDGEVIGLAEVDRDGERAGEPGEPASQKEDRGSGRGSEGRVSEHPIFPGKPGWSERRIADADDVADVLALLGLNYERAVSRRGAAAGSMPDATTRTRRGHIS